VKNPHAIWASVTIIIVLLAGTVVLSLNNKDITVVITLAGLLAVPVLAALGVAIYQKMDQVKEASNGNQDKLLKMIQELQSTVTGLALQVKPPEPDKTEVPWKDDHPS